MVHTTKRILDPSRINALRQTFLLDSKAEEAFDRLTSLAARTLGVPVSLISLVDTNRQFFKSASGFNLQETPLSHSFCKHVVSTGQPLVVNDARKHPAVMNNPAIHDLEVIGYLGMPICTSDGHNIGSLCVIDKNPRQWTQDEMDILKDLTNSVMMEVELRVQMQVESEVGRTLSDTDIYGKPTERESHYGAYKVIHKIASGGMADVYYCKHHVLNTAVAVKELRSTPKNYVDFLQRFQQEAKIVSRLKHPNIIRVFDFGTRNNNPYMVMEYIHGDDLSVFMKRFDGLRFEEDGAILLDIAEALDYAHSQGIIHRDVKPSNVMLRRRFRNGKPTLHFHATLMDFGVAKIQDSQQQLTQDDNLVGTVAYMSPEQIEGENIDYRSDLYSFGVMAYEFLTGHRPFDSSNIGTVLNGHLFHAIPDPCDYAPDLKRSQVAALRQILAKKPEDRPASALEFVKMLA